MLRLLALSCLILSGLTAQTETWIGGTGSWSTASNWSPAGVPATGDDVIVPTGGTLTLTVATNAVNSVSLVGTMIIGSGGNLTVSGTITITGGILSMQSGTLTDATVQFGSGGSFLGTTGGGTLTAVTIGAGTTFDLTQTAGVRCNIGSGLVLNGTIAIGAPTTTNYGQLYIVGSQTWSGTGSLVFGDSGNNSINSSGGSEVFSLPAGMMITGNSGTINFNSGGDSFTNAGTIDQTVSGGTIAISATNWTNSHIIECSTGGTLSFTSGTLGTNGATGEILSPNGGTVAFISGAWVNDGTIAGAGTTYDLNGSFTTASGLSLSTSGSNIINIQGQVDNSGGLDFTSLPNSWNLTGGTITGGTITMPTGGNKLVITGGGGTLSAVTIPAGSILDLTGAAGVRCSISGGLTLNGTIAIGAPTTTNYGQLYIVGSQTWSGTGSLVFGDSGNNSINSSGGSEVFSLPAGMTITGNSGTINFNSGGDSFTNAGTIDQTVSGGTIAISATNWTNSHIIECSTGGTLSFTSGTLGTNGATGEILSPNGGTVAFISGAWVNDGTIAGAGTTYDLNGSFTTASGLSLSTSGSNIINIQGQVDNSGGLDFTSLPNSWNLTGGTITGGTITMPTGDNKLVITGGGGTLSAVTIPAGSILDLTGAAGVRCNISGGLTLNGTIAIGSPTTTNYGQLYIVGSQTWSGTGSLVFGDSGNNSINSSGGSEVFSLPAGMTITGNSGTINFNSGGDSFTNAGTIDQTVSGGTIAISATNWTNSHIIECSTGGTLSFTSGTLGTNGATGEILSPNGGTVAFISGAWVNDGTIAGAGTTYDLNGSFTTASGLSLSTSGSNIINIQGQVDNSGGLDFTSLPNSWNLTGGTITGGTITMPTGGNKLVITGGGGTLSAVTIPAGSILDLTGAAGVRCSISGGLTLNGTIAIGAPTTTNYGQLYIVGSQTWSGTGSLVFGDSGNNSINSSGGSEVFSLPAGMTITGNSGTINFNSGGDSFTNAGTIDQTVSGGTIAISATNWTNSHIIECSTGGTLSFTSGTLGTNGSSGEILSPSGGTINFLGGPWINSGTISGANTTYNLNGSFTTASGLSLSTNASNVINIQGMVDNGGGLDFTSLQNSWNLAGGTITGGTITMPTGGNKLVITGGGGTLSAVTIPAASILDLTDAAGVRCNISGGLTLNGTIAIGSPTTTNYGQLYIVGSQTWSGTGSLVFGDSGNNSINSSGGSEVFSLPAGMTITGNSGTINFNSGGDSFTNAGTIDQTVSGGTIEISATNWTNAHIIECSSGGALSFSSGTLGTNGASGQILTPSGGTINFLAGPWINSGTISGANTTYNLNGSFTTASALSLSTTSSNVINIQGSLNNSASVDFTTLPNSWNLAGGTVTGGTITMPAGANKLLITGAGGTLSAVTIPSGSTLDMTGMVVRCNISGGLTLNGTIDIGSPTTANFGELYIVGSQTWSGSGSLVFGDSGNNSINSSGGSDVFTLPAGLTITGNSGQINFNSGGDAFTNSGTIASDVAGGAFAINATSWTNAGTMTLGVGTAQTWNFSGTFTQSSTGILNIDVGGTGDTDKLAINGTANLGGTLHLATIDSYFLNQADSFTIITTNAAGLHGTFSTLTGSFAPTYNSASLVVVPVDSTTPSVTVTNATPFSATATLVYTVQFSEPVTGLLAANLTATNGIVTNLSGSGQTYAATVSATNLAGAATSEVVTLQVPAAAAHNSGGHTNTASTASAITYEIPPTFTITPVNNAVVTGPPVFTITFSNPVLGLQASGLAITGTTNASITPSPTTLTSSYMVTTSMSGGGPVGFQLLANAVSDQAGNHNAASTPETVINDPAPPTITSITPSNNATVTGSPTFTVTISEAVTGLTSANVSVTGGAMGTISPSSSASTTTYTIPVTVTTSGAVTLTINAHAVEDALDGSNAAGMTDTITVNLTPTITMFTPTTGPIAGGTSVILTGTNFDANPGVTFHGVAGVVTAHTSTSITVTTPVAPIEGPAMVVETNADSLTATAPASFNYLGPAPTVTAISTAVGPIAGGTAVTLTGANFVSSTVTFGGVSATSVVTATSTTITLHTPPGADGPTTVVVTNLDGQSATLGSNFYYQGTPPSVSTITPLNGSSAGGTSVTLSGSNFIAGATVTIGGVSASVSSVTASTITAITGAGSPGPSDVVVTNPDLLTSTLVGGYDYISGAPSLSSVAPHVGPIAGSTAVVLTGTNFESGAGVTFGGIASGTVTVVNGTTIDTVTPAGADGPCVVRVTNPDEQFTTLSAGFVYQGPPPTIASVSPSVGPVAGGTPIIISGSNFLAGVQVTIGGVAATGVVLNNSTSLSAATPAGALGPATVMVTNTDLLSASRTSGFLYQGLAPTLTAVTPALGALSGGATVTLTGTNFAAGAVVTFGGIAATMVSVTNATTATATTPAGISAGSVTVVLTNADMQSATLTNGYLYQGPAPSIAAIVPAIGPQGGGTRVTITGANFVGGAGVTIAGAPATSVVVVNATTITATTSETSLIGPGSVVVNDVDDQTATLPNGFIYQGPLPSVTAVTPTSGATTGGTMVTVSGANFAAGATVTFGGVAGSISSLTPTTLTAMTPASPAGPVPVAVTNIDLQAGTLAGGFTYVSPMVTVAAAVSATNSAQIVFTVTYSLPVAGLTADQLTVANGSIGPISGGPLVFTVTVTPTSNGPVTLLINADEVTQTPASNIATVDFDTVPPSASLSVSSGLPLTAASTTLTIAFSEPVLGFTATALTISNATSSGFTMLDAATFTLQLTPTPNAVASIQVLIPAAICTDLAGNDNLAATLIVPIQTTILSTSVLTPAVGLSPGDGTLYTALCPGTWAGLAQIQDFLTGKAANVAVGYVWDAAVQGFVTVPARAPQGGWQPFQGVYIATRVAPSFDFNGYMATVDYALTLKPGWNFVGIPPLEDNGTETVSHNWADLRLEDTSGNLITGTERVGLIDVGAWAWNGSVYAQTGGALSSGVGYWIENSSSPGIDLVLRRLSAAELAGTATILGGHNPQLGRAIGYRSHTTPPMPPGQPASHDASSGSSCGVGSGMGVLLASCALGLRLRSRRVGTRTRSSAS